MIANQWSLQFIAGFGIPVDDLNIESITSGYVLKAQYYLPNRAKQLRVKDIHGITERQFADNATIFQQTMQKTDEELGIPTSHMDETTHALSGYRWAIYKSFETMAIRMNLNGRQCILKSLCENSAAPFDERNGLLGELLHILLTWVESEMFAMNWLTVRLKAFQLNRCSIRAYG